MSSRTLFVADIPPGLSEPEFAGLFQTGCEDQFLAARLRRDRNDNIVGFVDFLDHDSAEEAKARWEGYKFSSTDERGLTIHFSHSSSRPRRPAAEPTEASQSASYSPDDESADPSAFPSGLGGNMGVMGNMGAGMPVVSAFSEGLSPASMYTGSNNMMMPAGAYGTYSPSLFMQQPFTAQANPSAQSHQSLPAGASSTLYVEGLPLDASEREVSHIFRHYTGYMSVRILPKESKHPGRSYNLCFVEFENKVQATYAMHALQGYKMAMTDPTGLHISYAKSERRDRRRLFSEKV